MRNLIKNQVSSKVVKKMGDTLDKITDRNYIQHLSKIFKVKGDKYKDTYEFLMYLKTLPHVHLPFDLERVNVHYDRVELLKQAMTVKSKSDITTSMDEFFEGVHLFADKATRGQESIFFAKYVSTASEVSGWLDVMTEPKVIINGSSKREDMIIFATVNSFTV